MKGASGSSDSLSGDEVITFTARKSSSKFILFSVVVILVYQSLLPKKQNKSRVKIDREKFNDQHCAVEVNLIPRRNTLNLFPNYFRL